MEKDKYDIREAIYSYIMNENIRCIKERDRKGMRILTNFYKCLLPNYGEHLEIYKKFST